MVGKNQTGGVKTAVNFGKISFCNPVVPASGTFGYGREFSEIYDINVLGGISVKGTTREERFGNPTPRIAEYNTGIINSVGLQNPGIKQVVEKEIPELRKIYRNRIIANVSGFSMEEYIENCAAVNESSADIIEVNVSCPNVQHGGMSFGTDPALVKELTANVKEVTDKPVIIKLTPNVTDIVSVCLACEEGGADGISMINTLLGMRIDLKSKKPVLANRFGGVSGPGVFPVALRMVYQAYEAVNIPIMGMGGIAMPEDVIEMMLAGATAVQVGSANLVNPFACRDIVEGLPAAMKKYGIDDLESIIGGAH